MAGRVRWSNSWVIDSLTDPEAYGGNPAEAFSCGVSSLPGTATPKGPRPPVGALTASPRPGRPDGAPRLHALGRAGRRLRISDHDRARCAGRQEHCAGIHITLAFNGDAEGRGPADSGGEARAGGGSTRMAIGVTAIPSRRPPGRRRSARPNGFTERAGGLDPGEVLGLDRSRRRSRKYREPRRAARYHHPLLGERNGHIVGAAQLGELLAGQANPHKVNVPTGVAVFPRRSSRRCRRWMEPNFPNITHWSEMEKGGHFAAFGNRRAMLATSGNSSRRCAV